MSHALASEGLNCEGVRGSVEQWTSVFRPVSGEALALGRLRGELGTRCVWGPIEGVLTPRIGVDYPNQNLGRTLSYQIFTDLKDARIEWKSPFLDLRLGYQWISWGAADKINPVDVVNPVDMTDPFFTEKLSLPLLRFDLHPPEYSDWNFQGVLTPFFRPTRLPIDFPVSGTRSVSVIGSRWGLLAPTRVEVAGVSSPIRYEVSAPTYPQTWALGFRLSSMTIPGMDLALTAYTGVENTPRVGVSVAGDASDPEVPTVVTLHPSYHRHTVAGLDGATSLVLGDQEFGIRFEAAMIFRDNSRAFSAPASFHGELVKATILYAVIGTDTTLPFSVLGSTMYLNLQYVHYQVVGSETQAGGTAQVSGLPNLNLWDRNLVLYLENRWESPVKFFQAWILDIRYGDGIWNPKIQYALSDVLSIEGGPQFFFGGGRGFFGQMKDNSRFTLEARFLF